MGFHVISNNAAEPSSDDYLQKEKHAVPDNPRSNEHSFFLLYKLYKDTSSLNRHSSLTNTVTAFVEVCYVLPEKLIQSGSSSGLPSLSVGVVSQLFSTHR